VKTTDDIIYPTEEKTSENTQNEKETSQLSYDIDKLADCVSLAET
jgi:hypothetical protein